MITIKDVSKLNPTEIAMTASKRHIQSVIEDLILCVHEAEYNALRKESSEWLKEHDKEMLATAQAEIEASARDFNDCRNALDKTYIELASHEATIKVLREALLAVANNMTVGFRYTNEGQGVLDALTLPVSNEHLREFGLRVAKAVDRRAVEELGILPRSNLAHIVDEIIGGGE